jgi:hypothetical protein
LKATTFFRRVVLFAAILISGGSLAFPRGPLLAIIILFSLFGSSKNFTLSKKIAPIAVLLLGVLIVTVFFHEDFDASTLLTRFAAFIGALFIFNIYIQIPREDFHEDLYALLKWMPYQAIITVILTILVPTLFVHTAVSDENGVLISDYDTIGFVFTYHVMIEGLQGLKRPDGLFFEPGVFQVYLNLLLYLCLFVYKKRWFTVVTIIALVTTQSTMGLIISLIIVIYYVAVEQRNKSFLSRFKYIFFGIIMLVPLLIFTNSNLNDKLSGEQRGSSWSRQYDLITGLNIIKENPLSGIGFDYKQFYKQANTLGEKNTELDLNSTKDKNNTNGITFLFYSIGIPLALPFLIGLFRSSLFKHKFLIGTIIFLSLNSESIIFTPFFLLIIYSGISQIDYSKVKKRAANKIKYYRTSLEPSLEQ